MAEQRKARKEELVEGLERHFGTLRETIEDLQEAQCYFLLASQIAALIAVNKRETEAGETTRYPRFLEATNFYQLNNNYILLSLIGICGFLPIGIVYSILMLSGQLRLPHRRFDYCHRVRIPIHSLLGLDFLQIKVLKG